MALTKIERATTLLNDGWAAFNSLIDDLLSTSNGKGASQVGIEDSAGNVDATNVEDAIAEIYSDFTAVKGLSDTFDENTATTTGLTWGFKSGTIRLDNTVTDISAGTVGLTDDSTNYVEIDPSDTTVKANTSSFTSGRIPIREVVTSSGAQTTSTDRRAWFDQVAAGTSTSAGILELATDAETATGTDNARAITPANLKSMILDEDNMSSDSAVRVPTQQSTKAYVDTTTADFITLSDLPGIDDNCTVERLDLTDTLIDVLTGAKLRTVDGLLFGSDTAAANTLDDYEEGTWTGTISDGVNDATMSASTCTYTKIGRHVFICGQIASSSLGSVSGNIRITGLPFTCANGNQYSSTINVGYATGLAISAGQCVSGTVTNNTTYINLRLWDETTGGSSLVHTEWTADGSIFFSGHYIAA